MLIALVAMVASAETYNYLKFTKTDNTTLTYSVEGLKVTYDASNVYITNAEGSATIALAQVRDMYFSNEGGTTPTVLTGDVNNSGDVTIADVTALIDYLLSGDESSINIAAADCNNSTDVSIADVTALIDYLLSGNW